MNNSKQIKGNLEIWFKIIDSIDGKFHDPRTKVYKNLKEELKKEIEEIYGEGKENKTELGEDIGEIIFPYLKLSDETGNVNSVNLFDIDEFIIFLKYKELRKRCKKAADLGANIGLHTIILQRLGYETKSWEPDRFHFKIMIRNLKLNKVNTKYCYQKAVTVDGEDVDFVKVHGNTTGSHVAGAKVGVYGETSVQKVSSNNFQEILSWAELIKMDVEGFEGNLLTSVDVNCYRDKCLLVEIGNEKTQI